jgi:nitrite reductase/ring-hydroxylating ferredoxin subunit
VAYSAPLRRWAKQYPELGTGPVATAPYASPEFFALERERVFRRAWLNVGRVEELPAPGDFALKEIAICDASILLIRGPDGAVRGFHNVCSHRGNRLVTEARGACRGYLTCNFHSWGYDSLGNLKWVPDEGNFANLDKSAHGLTPVATEVWNGFVFVHLDPAPREPLIEYLGGVADQLAGAPFDRLALAYAYAIDETANWKVGLDAQNEVYHLPFQHRYAFPDNFLMDEQGHCRVTNLRLFGRHSVYSCSYNPEHKLTPSEALVIAMDNAASECRMPRIGDFDFYTIFPNFCLLLFRGAGGDVCQTFNFWPLAVDRTVWEIRMYQTPARNAGQLIAHEYWKRQIRNVIEEDATAHETVHAGVASGAKPHMVLQDDEIQIRHFHEVLESCVRGDARA